MTRDASSLLAEAEYYHRSGDHDLAREACERLVAEHGGAEGAARARQLLVELEAAPADATHRKGSRANARGSAASAQARGLGYTLTLIAQALLLAISLWDVVSIFGRTRSLDACAGELLLAAVFAVLLLGTLSVRAPGGPAVTRRLAAAVAVAGYGAFAAAVLSASEGLVESLGQRPLETGAFAVLLIGGLTWLARSTWHHVEGHEVFEAPRGLLVATVALSAAAALAASWLHPWCVRTFLTPTTGDFGALMSTVSAAESLRENATAVSTWCWLPFGLWGLIAGTR